VAVTASQFISVADITAGLLQFTPAVNANGAPYRTFTFQVQDDGGTAMAVSTRRVSQHDHHQRDRGQRRSLRRQQDGHHAGGHGVYVHGCRFRLQRPQRRSRQHALGVKISALPTAGTLTDNGVAVTAGQFVTLADIAAGLLKFTPAATPMARRTPASRFQVQDNGGTVNGGVDLDQSPNTITVNVTAVNDAPSGADKTVTTLEDTAYTFTAADFGFSDSSDSPANTLLAVKVSTLLTAGTLANNGVAVTTGQFVSVANINSGLFKFTPAVNANGLNYASFTFQVQDNGGTVNGGVDLDQSPNTITVNVTSVNDAPAGANNTVTALEDAAYTFTAADFGFSDPSDSPANTLLAVKVSTLRRLAASGIMVWRSLPASSSP